MPRFHFVGGIGAAKVFVWPTDQVPGRVLEDKSLALRRGSGKQINSVIALLSTLFLVLLSVAETVVARLDWIFKFRKDHFSKDKTASANEERQKSKPLRLHHRLVIALHSPEEVVETGLLGCPLEKMALSSPPVTS
jgi:hypothetical protein